MANDEGLTLESSAYNHLHGVKFIHINHYPLALHISIFLKVDGPTTSTTHVRGYCCELNFPPYWFWHSQISEHKSHEKQHRHLGEQPTAQKAA